MPNELIYIQNPINYLESPGVNDPLVRNSNNNHNNHTNNNNRKFLKEKKEKPFP